MTTPHYFSEHQPDDSPRVERTVRLRGKDYSVLTASGVFAHDKVDRGTAVFLAKVPNPDIPDGSVALDLGCGWGPMTLALCDAAPNAQVWAVDVNERARHLTEENLRRAGLKGTVLDPQAALERLADRRIALLWSNPPVRIGKQELHKLLTTWLSLLADDGVAYLVVQRNLGADSLQKWLQEQGFTCERLGSAKGYRVFEVRPGL